MRQQPQGQHDRQDNLHQNAPSIQAEQIEFDFASTARGPIEVIDAVTMRAEKVADVVLDFLGGARPQPRGTAAEVMAEYRANAALTRMAESQARGERLQAADVAALTHHQLLNVRDKGDDYLRQLIDDNEKHSRENYVDSQKREEKERERER